MNELTLLTTLKTKLIAQVWTGGGSVVFPTGCVYITANVDLAMESALKTMRTPICLIQPLDSTSDPDFGEDPRLTFLNVNIRIVVMVPGDAVGENAIIGGNKTGGSTASEGRGLFEVSQELFNAIGQLNDNESLQLQNTQSGAANAAIVDDKTYVAWRDFRFTAKGTLV